MINNNFSVILYIMKTKIKLLFKRIFSHLEILIVIDSKIFYLKIKPINDCLIIEKIYMMEELPDLIELQNRITYYIENESYEPMGQSRSKYYLVRIINFLDALIHHLPQSQLLRFDDLYIGNHYHPDLLSLYRFLKVSNK